MVCSVLWRLLAAPSPVRAADPCLLTNGDFSASVPAAGTGGGWTTTSSLGGWSATGGHPLGYFWLNNSGQSGSDPAASQTVSGLKPGESYVLSGEYASISHNSTPAGVEG